MENESHIETCNILERIDSLRLWSIKKGDFYRNDFSRRVAVFTSTITSQYERTAYWAVPAYHKLVGSSQQRERLETEKLSEITERIESFIAAVEKDYGIYA